MLSGINLAQFAFDPVGFARELLKFYPDPKQAEALGATERRVVLNCSRQWGKSTVAAAKMVHVAVTRPGRTVMMLSENLPQAGEVFLIIDAFLARLGIPLKNEPGKKHGRRLPNGSRIFAVAAREAAVRGYTAHYVFLDEAARIDDDVIDAFAPVVMAKKGDWWMASTPQGMRGRFFEMWEYGDPALVKKIRATVSENPRIDPAYVEQVRREKGDAYVRQEFGCEFVENGTHLFNRGQIMQTLVM
jgi:hypothetical protein